MDQLRRGGPRRPGGAGAGGPDTTDGAADGELADLSTRARFEKFARDFRAEEGDGISYDVVKVDGRELVQLTRGALYEFLAKKDYVDSWYSEAHEAFCFFSPDEWVALLEANGFVMTRDTRPIRNPWLIENRFSPAATVYVRDGEGSLVEDDWSWTNVLLVAQKPED